jgi:hypothetical protein
MADYEKELAKARASRTESWMTGTDHSWPAPWTDPMEWLVKNFLTTDVEHNNKNYVGKKISSPSIEEVARREEFRQAEQMIALVKGFYSLEFAHHPKEGIEPDARVGMQDIFAGQAEVFLNWRRKLGSRLVGHLGRGIEARA